ncbi:hypothetical protein [Plebeiibacterium sediminum]|uniref:Uncharacterized protein n=1 Tax=Plebeiibacterium sediminum TaxID=2992112 RepID=A0AAE3M7T8_9BACT|nr:hypothetical protein [Plebeiobacterium sediminum]MCW3788532.1 hypothetical protein [Plebeiobacterium sediminum]
MNYMLPSQLKQELFSNSCSREHYHTNKFLVAKALKSFNEFVDNGNFLLKS